MEPLNTLDVVITIGFALSMLIAFIRGFVKEMLSILGLAIFIILSTYLSPMLLTWMNKYIESKTLSYIVIVLFIMAIFYAVWIISTDKLIAKIRTSTLSFMDRLFGLLFGLLRAVLILGFCFLVIKITLPEELKEDPIHKSKYYIVAQTSSDVIEAMLPEDFINSTVKSVEKMNKVEKKDNKAEDKKKDSKDNKDKKAKEQSKSKEEKMPSNLDQEQMNKMFEKLINPEIKTEEKNKDKKQQNEKKSYNNKETNGLDRLIDITAE